MSPAEAAVARVAEAMYRGLAEGDAGAVCNMMSRRAHHEISQQVPGGSTAPPSARTCVDSLGRFLDVAAQNGILERTLSAEVTDVRIDGASATATVAIGGRDGEIGLVREGGRWVVGAPPSLGK